MLDFITELDRLLEKWPQNARWTVAQVAEFTKSPVPVVLECLSKTLEQELDVQDQLSIEEAGKALLILKEKMHGELEARIKQQKALEKEALRKYEVARERTAVLEIAKNWRTAYKTLSYFAGVHCEHLPRDLRLNLLGDCLRLGGKAQINLQELGQWLRKGIEACVNSPSIESFEDAIDFVDAYADYFAENGGEKFLQNVISMMRPGLFEFNLTPKLETVLGELSIDCQLAP